MIGSLFILTTEGDVLIEKHYMGYQSRAVVDTFMTEVAKYANKIDIPPVFPTPKQYLFHVQHADLFFLTTTRKDGFMMSVFEFLQRLVEVLRDYFKGDVTEAGIKEQFTVVYQLLDEMADGGLVFATESNMLQEIVSGRSLADNFLDALPDTIGGVELPASIRDTLSRSKTQAQKDGTLSPYQHRKLGVSYMSNAIYFDICEEVSCIVDKNQMLLAQEVTGDVNVKCELSGMPQCVLAFNNTSLLDEVSFHSCVNYQRWLQGRVVAFVPPDGSFKLLSYRLNQTHIPMPIYCKPQINFSDAGGRVFVMVGSKTAAGKPLENVRLAMPFARVVSTVMFTATQGSVSFDDLTKICTWDIGKITATQDAPQLNGTVTLVPGARAPEENPTLLLNFKLDGVTTSGLRIQECQILNEPYKAYKGMKSSSRAGKFQVRS